ncbi:MAG: hypothetical protein LRY63_01345 [Nitrincola sp.]|nr:hypothetical protein [Nitrincola sp.]
MNASETSLTSSKALHDQRDSFSILFLGFSREKAAATQASLQSVNLLPRCRIISNERELSGSLAERSWDLLLLSNMNTQDLSFGRAAEVLKELNKDIPILLLCEKCQIQKLIWQCWKPVYKWRLLKTMKSST